ncbi:MAG: EAL domain-containing protein [Leptospira sp.]|nr:EAL domain-containing protein [Leptospira sp.]
MNICFLDKGGFSPDNLKSLNALSNSNFSIRVFTLLDDLEEFINKQNASIIFTEFSISDKDLSKIVSRIKSNHKYALLVNKISNEELSEEYLKIGFDIVFYTKNFNYIDHIIHKQEVAIKEKHERDMLLSQLEISYRELQFQKYALDQSAVVSITNKDGVITGVNQKFCDLTGYSSHEVIGKNHNILNSGYHKKSMWKEFYETLNKGELWKGEVQNLKKDGTKFWIDLTVVPFLDVKNNLYKLVAIQFDITYRMLAEQQLTHDAFYDPNTGLPNRSLFLAKLEEYISRSFSNPGEKLAVLVLNIKQFNRINNTYGFLFGDKVIGKISVFLKKWDVGIPYFPARLGGDSFGIIMMSTKLTNENLSKYVDHFQSKFDAPIQIDSVDVFLHFSIGIAIRGEGGGDGEELLKNAELAMFECKSNYSRNYIFFQKSMTEEIQKRMKIHFELKQAVKNGEIISYFQPIYSAEAGKLSGFESLVRWNHPVKGLLSPFHFLGIAEESGMIVPISDLVYKHSFRFLKEVFRINPELNEKLFISLNISSYQFEESLIEYFLDLINDYGIESKLVHLEITESLAMRDFQKTIKIIKAFREKGFSISLDDFGTGYSSLSYLKKFPIDHLKIDKSFVDGIVENSQDRIILESVIQLGKNLGMSIIAEGVESLEQLTILKEYQTEYAQGYYFNKPLSESDALALIEKNLDNIF